MSRDGVALQDALHNALSADLPLGELVNGIFDHVPRGTEVPYVVIGEDAVSQDRDKDNSFEEHAITIHAWTAGEGRRPVRVIQAAVQQVLDDATGLVLTGANLIRLDWEFSDNFDDPDGVHYHGVQRLRVITETINP